jgi:hypothetical protein
VIPAPIALWDFTVSDGGLSTEGDVRQWQWGSAAVGRDTVWKTRLFGSYLNDGSDALLVDLPAIAALTRPVLVVSHSFDILAGDRGVVQVDDGAGWRTLTPVYGYPSSAGFVGASGGQVASSFLLDGVGPEARLRLWFASDAAGAASGWSISSLAVYDGDMTPPRLEPIAVPTDTANAVDAYVVQLAAQDDVGVLSVVVRVQVDGGTPFSVYATETATGWIARLPPQALGATISWRAEATDGVQTTRWPPEEESSFRVFLPPPSGVVVDVGRVAQQLGVRWDPLEIDGVDGYEVEDGQSGERWSTATPSITLPLTSSGSHPIRVRGRLLDGDGDWSAPVSTHVEVPRLFAVTPAALRRGELVRVELRGESLYLGSRSSLDVGLGVRAVDWAVTDVNSANAVLEVAPDAAVGPRDLVLTSAWGRWVFSDAVAIDASAPAGIVSIAPEALLQGETVTVAVRASEAFGPSVVEVGADPALLVVPSVPDGASVTLEVAVGPRATPGTHQIILDDGVRWWAVPVTVVERTVQQRTCAHVDAGVGGLGYLAFAVAFWRFARRQSRSICRASATSRSVSACASCVHSDSRT